MYDGGKVPDVSAVLWVLTLKLRDVVTEALLPVPPGRAGNTLVLQPAADVVRPLAVYGVPINLTHNPRGVLVNQKMVSVLRVLLIPKRRKTAGEFPGLCLGQIGRMYFFTYVTAVKFV